MIGLFSIDGSKLTSLKGEVSLFRKVELKDIECMSFSEINMMYKTLEQDLIHSEFDFLRFYFRDQSIYLQCPEYFNLSGFDLKEEHEPIKKFGFNIFDEINFYEDYLLYNNQFLRLIKQYETEPSKCT